MNNYNKIKLVGKYIEFENDIYTTVFLKTNLFLTFYFKRLCSYLFISRVYHFRQKFCSNLTIYFLKFAKKKEEENTHKNITI